jgi:hypothetical protein
MKLVSKSIEKIVIELTTNEIESNGFEHWWDRIRKTYKAEDYDVDSIGASHSNDKIIFIELISRRLRK